MGAAGGDDLNLCQQLRDDVDQAHGDFERLLDMLRRDHRVQSRLIIGHSLKVIRPLQKTPQLGIDLGITLRQQIESTRLRLGGSSGPRQSVPEISACAA